METFIGIIVGLLVLMLLVTAHEFGHFLAARKNGVRVLEFGICFPPRAIAWVKDEKTKKWKRLPKSEWGKPQKGLIFSLNWLPIGGFCQMDGESDADTRPGTFGAASFWAKTKILFAGVGMNWLIAFIIFTILAWTGMPIFLDNQFTVANDTNEISGPVTVSKVLEDSPAAAAGFRVGDEIVSVDGNEVKTTADVIDYNSAHAGETVNYVVLRETTEQVQCVKAPCPPITLNKEVSLAPTLNPSDSEYSLGITMSMDQTFRYSTWSAPIVGAGLTLQLTGETFSGVGQLIGNLFSGVVEQFSGDDSVREAGQEALSSAKDSVSGPVGIIGYIFPTFTSAGPANLAYLTALISVSLACMNVIPIPALDGGRWLLIAIFKLRKKELTKEVEEKIVSRAMIFLLGLIFIVTVIDITRFFQ